jgi:hypothetical protein
MCDHDVRLPSRSSSPPTELRHVKIRGKANSSARTDRARLTHNVWKVLSMSSPRAAIVATASVLLAPLLVVPLASSTAVAGGPATPRPLASSIAVSWQRTAIRTIYTPPAPVVAKAPPDGALYLAFTSLAVYQAAREAQRHSTHAAAAAVATAAHDVLWKYFPASRGALDSDLDASLAMVPDGKQEDAGTAIGATAAAAMIASRETPADGRNNNPPVPAYTKQAAPGIWPAVASPPPPGGMALHWLGFVRRVVDVEPVALDGPDELTSPAYTQDYQEARELGAVGSVDRSPEQTAVANFFSGNPVLMYRAALCSLLEAEPLGLLPTTRLFARIDAAVANSFIQTWKLKYEVGFWRPLQAIAGPWDDDNPLTQAQPGWSPLVPNPAYSDYTSGHGTATSPFAQVVRRTLGDDTPLVLVTPSGVTRSYTTLTALEHDALNARIWGGLHFRDAMEDTYYMGHTTADRVIKAIR